MRLFVAVWPSPAVIDRLENLSRPAHADVRWTTPDQWHVTLRFLGQVDEVDLPSVASAIEEAARAVEGAITAEAGPRSAILGRAVLYLPVDGLDPLAAATRRTLAGFGSAQDERAFRGHLTLARAKRGRPVPRGLAGADFVAAWEVTEVALVESTLLQKGARYTTVATAALG